MNTKTIGFIGGGNMAASLVAGLIESGHSAAQIWVADVNPDALMKLSQRWDVRTVEDNLQVANNCDVIVLAVKPQHMEPVCRQLAPSVRQHNPLIISIAAGVTQAALMRDLGENAAIVRCMPNTPALVQSAATGLFANANVTDEQRGLAENILRAVGLCLWLTYESELHAVTAVSGSGPAYYFLMMEAMEKAGIELGLSENTARLLVQQTALGAAKIAMETDESPATLRTKVTSPGGTTESALEVFQQGEFIQLVSHAMHAARDKSIEISLQMGGQ